MSTMALTLPAQPTLPQPLLPPQQQSSSSAAASSVRLKNYNGLLQYLPLRERFFKVHGDLKIVCHDGSLHWSSLLMSTWSKVAKAFCSDERLALASEDKIVLMVPQVKVSIMKLVLQWSLEGQLTLAGNQTLGEVMWALQSLGNTVGLSLTEVPRTDKCCNEIIDVDDEVDKNVLGLGDAFTLSVQDVFSQGINGSDGALKCNVPKDPLRSYPNQTLLDEEEVMGEDSDEITIIEDINVTEPAVVLSTPAWTSRIRSSLRITSKPKKQNGRKTKCSPVKKMKISCLLCSTTSHSYKNYLKHLSIAHYKHELVQRYIGGSGTHCRCPVCRKMLPTSSRENSWKAQHLGVAHEYVLEVAQAKVRTHLEMLKKMIQLDN